MRVAAALLLGLAACAPEAPAEAPPEAVGIQSAAVVVGNTNDLGGDLFFVDDLTGWATTNNGTGWDLTLDGGLTWLPGPGVALGDMTRIMSPDGIVVVAADQSGSILRSLDGGFTGTTIPSNVLQSDCGLWFFDSDVGLVFEFGGGMNRTDDAGSTWVEDNTFNTSASLRAEGIDIGTVYWPHHDIFGDSFLAQSFDTGVTWDQKSIPGLSSASNASFVSPDIGWVIDNSAVVYTDDGGNTWEDRTPPSGFFLDVLFIDAFEGWVVGVSGLIWHTLDGGITWSTQTSPTLNNIEAVVLGGSTVFARAGTEILQLTEVDSDGDGVPDFDDQCPGFDDSFDLDFDGVPDGCDLCEGDDATADIDFDAYCGDSDFCFGNDLAGDLDLDGVCDDLDAFPLDPQVGDGDTDLLAAHQDFAVCDSDGLGTLTCSNEGEGITDAQASVAGDFSGDGLTDFVIGQSPGNARLCINDGLDTWLCSDVPGLTDVWGLRSQDLNGDGALDLVASLGGAEAQVCLGDGFGTFSCSAVVGSAVPVDWAGIALDDVSGDGIPDLITNGLLADAVVSLGDGLGGFSPLATVPGTAGHNLGLADLDGDGDLDLVGGTEWCFNDGFGDFPVCDFTRAPLLGMDSADLDGDVLPDVVLTVDGADPPICINNLTTSPSCSVLTSFVAGEPELLDVDGDSDLDLVLLGDAGPAEERLCLNDGVGGFTCSLLDIPNVSASLVHGADGLLGVDLVRVPDADGDGSPTSVDCDDLDPTIFPGAPEFCDQLDTDCDGFLNYDGNDELDFDEDGLCDTEDPDIDNDGSDDLFDLVPFDPFLCTDDDLDGCDDCTFGAYDLLDDGDDFDGDGLCDLGDPDGDNDGVDNVFDLVPFDPLLCTDDDLDGCDDCASGTYDPLDDGADLDGDGLCDVADPDADGDGVDAPQDLAPLDPFLCADDDSDLCDDCSTGTYDPLDDGADFEGDGFCDLGDPDDDNDGIDDVLEGADDPDGDLLPNWFDDDSDGDGFLDLEEGDGDPDEDLVPNFLDLDSDGNGTDDDVDGDGDLDADGTPDYLDIDDFDGPDADLDGDGLTNGEETTAGSDPADPDTDGDGVGDLEGVGDPNNPLNSDGDSLIDAQDPDDDDDGIDTFDEMTVDVDGDLVPDLDFNGDGILNHLDGDSDGDGIDDEVELLGDPDGDGIPNFADDDSDGDGNPDAVEGSGDVDLDGIQNYVDANDFDGPGADADGDGISTQDELDLGLDPEDEDSDGDGLLDPEEVPDPANPEDFDGDGLIDGLDPDDDEDGIPTLDEVNVDADGDGVPDLDVDGDGEPNHRDEDSDDDGLLDGDEGSGDSDGDGAPDYVDLDSDDDGLDDAEEGAGDFDEDGVPNYLDSDSDDDGLPDGLESADDFDGDGAPNYLDLDSDDDGRPDAEEGTTDTDGGGSPDFLDEDSDADGVPDLEEEDGDADGDGVPNYRDTDSDDDGTPDGEEDPGGDVDGDGIFDPYDLDDEDGDEGDQDQDGLSNGLEAAEETDPTNPDTDHDGLLDGDEVHRYGTDPTNPDTDGDLLGDGLEVSLGLDPLDADSDPDQDAVVSSQDNCPLTPNPDQANIDQDELGDVCDPVNDLPYTAAGGVDCSELGASMAGGQAAWGLLLLFVFRRRRQA